MRVHLTDLNDDGDPDIVVGGKELNRPASVGYFSSPTPRVASSWVWHPITPAGWVMQMEVVDMDGDFDLDIVYTDRDPIDVGVTEPDTSKMGLRWLENDGAPTPDWTEHNISPMISPTVGERYHKWFTLDHWDSDGEPDIIDCRSATDLTPDNEMSIWLNGGDAASWTELSVPVPDDIGLCQHATVADVNTVGGKDLGFTFADAGELTGDPDTKSGVIWLKNSGTPTSPSWTRHEIGGSEVGIKYDNLIWRDLDDDGDLDALTSEQHEDTDDDAVLGPGLGVVWYENPDLAAEGAARERSDRMSLKGAGGWNGQQTLDIGCGHACRAGGNAACRSALARAAQADAVFDVTDFGATGDGVTDDSEAFRDAIAAADAAAGTNTLLIPAGTYVLDRPANNVIGIIRMDGVTNVDVVGAGPTSIVKWKARNWSTGADPHLFSCDGCSFVSFSDLAVDGTHGEAGFAGQEQMHALFFLNSADITMDNVDFTDTFGNGVAVIGNCGGLTEDLVVSNSTFFSSNRSGIGVQGGTRRMEFVSNHFEAGSDQDIDFEPTGSFPDPDHDNCAPPTEPDPPRPGPEDILIQNNTFLRDEDAACHIVEGVQACTFAVTTVGRSRRTRPTSWSI